MVAGRRVNVSDRPAPYDFALKASCRTGTGIPVSDQKIFSAYLNYMCVVEYRKDCAEENIIIVFRISIFSEQHGIQSY